MPEGRSSDTDDLIAEQVAYYQARAPEYDDWWERRGPEWDLGAPTNESWRQNVTQLDDALAASGVGGRVLELAGGTGNWTGPTRRIADHLTVIDSSPETLAINREKNGDDGIDFRCEDLFDWQPDGRYDAVVFAFWISHVPAERWSAFWAMVASALEPEGIVWFCDNAHPAYFETHAPVEVWATGNRKMGEGTTPGRERHTRTLRDGRRFAVVKRFWHPPDLVASLRAEGFGAEVANTDWAFIHGVARPDHGSV